MKVTAFNGSPRTNGNTSLLIGHACMALNNEGIETEVVQVGGKNLHGCRVLGENMAWLLQRIAP